MTTHTIIVPDWHPSPLNKLSGHWGNRSRLKKADREIVAHYTKSIPKATERRRLQLTIELAKGQRACDPDAYFKSLCDALVKAGMLVNDSWAWVELLPVKFMRGEKRTVIELEDA